ncbi:MAG: hypothetical protein Q7T57_09035 [Dehalococcoidales bacterium]|nr:hypothetical protein [Dehalococcoidales bacterium]
MLALLAAILAPVLIWVGLFVVIRQPILRVMRRVGVFALVFLAGVSTPVLIWVGLFVALKERVQEYQLKRAPSRTIAEILGAAGLSVQQTAFPGEMLEDTIFMPRPMSEIHGIFARAGL